MVAAGLWQLALNVMRLICRPKRYCCGLDRHNINPPLIVELWVYKVHDIENGTSPEKEMDIEE